MLFLRLLVVRSGDYVCVRETCSTVAHHVSQLGFATAPLYGFRRIRLSARSGVDIEKVCRSCIFISHFATVQAMQAVIPHDHPIWSSHLSRSSLSVLRSDPPRTGWRTRQGWKRLFNERPSWAGGHGEWRVQCSSCPHGWTFAGPTWAR